MNKEQQQNLKWSYFGVIFSIFGIGALCGFMLSGIFEGLFLVFILVALVLYWKSSTLLFKTINGKLEGNNNNKVSDNDTKKHDLNH